MYSLVSKTSESLWLCIRVEMPFSNCPSVVKTSGGTCFLTPFMEPILTSADYWNPDLLDEMHRLNL